MPVYQINVVQRESVGSCIFFGNTDNIPTVKFERVPEYPIIDSRVKYEEVKTIIDVIYS